MDTIAVGAISSAKPTKIVQDTQPQPQPPPLQRPNEDAANAVAAAAKAASAAAKLAAAEDEQAQQNQQSQQVVQQSPVPNERGQRTGSVINTVARLAGLSTPGMTTPSAPRRCALRSSVSKREVACD
jgi:hypothetical protein